MSENVVNKTVDMKGDGLDVLESCAGGNWGYVWDRYR